jgi:hypothetical protein
VNDPPNRYVWQVVSYSPFRFFLPEGLGGGVSTASDPVGVMAALAGPSGGSLASCYSRDVVLRPESAGLWEALRVRPCNHHEQFAPTATTIGRGRCYRVDERTTSTMRWPLSESRGRVQVRTIAKKRTSGIAARAGGKRPARVDLDRSRPTADKANVTDGSRGRAWRASYRRRSMRMSPA